MMLVGCQLETQEHRLVLEFWLDHEPSGEYADNKQLAASISQDRSKATKNSNQGRSRRNRH